MNDLDDSDARGARREARLTPSSLEHRASRIEKHSNHDEG